MSFLKLPCIIYLRCASIKVHLCTSLADPTPEREVVLADATFLTHQPEGSLQVTGGVCCAAVAHILKLGAEKYVYLKGVCFFKWKNETRLVEAS